MVQDVWQVLARNNANSGGGALPLSNIVWCVGLIRDLEGIRSIVLKEYKAHAGLNRAEAAGHVWAKRCVMAP